MRSERERTVGDGVTYLHLFMDAKHRTAMQLTSPLLLLFAPLLPV